MKKLILASQSPRRQELLRAAGFEFEVVAANVEEHYPPELEKEKIALYLAMLKAKAVQQKIKEEAVIIGADTIVVIDNIILGKPTDEQEAARMLQILSGREHEVITGVAVLNGQNSRSFYARTKVFFKKLNKQEINFYIKKYNPFDKAGGYAIQEWIGMIGIEKIEGDYFNVVGLPVNRLYQELQSLCI